jgi:hypothetical protein
MKLLRGAALQPERRQFDLQASNVCDSTDEREASVIDVSQALGTRVANLKGKMRDAGISQYELKVFHKWQPSWTPAEVESILTI